MNSRILFFLIFITSTGISYGQELDEPYKKEYAIGINFNTNGGLVGGIHGRFSRFKKKNIYESYTLEIVNVKHLREERVSSPATGNPFIYGKQNYLFSIRPQYGRNFVLFNKAPEEGVQVDAVFAIGPTFAIIKPYMVEYEFTSDSVVVEGYNPERHNDLNKILGSGGAVAGFDKATLRLGLNLKAGLSFEFGSNAGNVSGIEIGGLIEAFPKKVILMNDNQNNVKNKAVFTSLYLNIYYGRRD